MISCYFLKGDGEHEWHMMDGSIVSAHRHAAGAKTGQSNEGLGKSCGGFSTKIHCKSDAIGMPLTFIITGGAEADMNQAINLLGMDTCEYLLADKGYDSNALRTHLNQNSITPVIPGRKNRLDKVVYDRHIYKERNAIERLFCRLKKFRRIATRYDKTAVMFKAGLLLASILIWLRV